MQTVTTDFHNQANKDMVPLAWGAAMSFDKVWDDGIEFGSYDSSQYDSGDLYAPLTDDPLNFWDYYKYLLYSNRLTSMEWSREIDFPYSVSAAMADFTFNNTDDFFTPGAGSAIDGYILPKRPVRLYAGYANEKIQQFIGITGDAPTIDEDAKTASFHATDFLTEIFALNLYNVLAMQDVTTDEVLAAIFDQFNISSSSYSLAKGRNRIPFVFFEKGKNAGNAIREIMQAEGGLLWINEQGVIIFETRLPQVNSAVYVLDDSNTFSLTRSGETGIINSVKITTPIRKVTDYRDVYSDVIDPDNPTIDPNKQVIGGNSSGIVTASLADPCLTINEPSLGETAGDSWFTAIDLSGNEITSGVSVTGVSLTSSQYTIFIQNDNSTSISINQLYLWGKAARLINTLNYQAQNQDSVDKYGIQQLGGDDGITNDFFGSFSNADSFAETIIDAYKDLNPTIEAEIAGDLSLQLGDIVDVQTRGINDNYRLTSIAPVIYPYSFKIKATRYNPREYSFYDVTQYDVGIYAP